MEIRFASSELAKLCNCSASIDRRWGKQIGTAIRQRLCLLAGTPTLELLTEFAGLMKEPVRLDPHGCFSVAVISGYRFLVKPDHKPIPFLRNQELDCTKIKTLMIVEVHSNGH
jgi:hypothetical protein